MTHMLPGQAAQAALREEHLQEAERAGEMLSDVEIAALSDSIQNGLVGLRRPGGMRYPRFQLVAGCDGGATVPPAWPQLRDMLAPADWSEEDLLMWILSPNAYLEGGTPAQEIQAHPTEATARLGLAVDSAIPWTKGPLR